MRTLLFIKLIQLAGSLLNWNVIRDQLTPSILKVVELFSREVIRVEEDINHSNQRNEDLGLQRFAKTLLMIHRNRRRLEEPLRHISLMDFGLFDSDVGSRTLEHKSKIQQQLSDLETSTISLCQRELNTKLSVCLAKNLMRKSSQTEVVSFTFNLCLINFIHKICVFFKVDFGHNTTVRTGGQPK